jgi:predicted MFS family arabinose efflux permease
MVAVVQSAITLGAAGGGLLYDAGGYRVTFVASAVLLTASAVVGMLDACGALMKKTEASERNNAIDRNKESYHVQA